MKHGYAALCAGLAMCLSFQAAGQAPGELQSSSRLTEDPGKHDSWTYRNPDANLATYKRFIIEPTAIRSEEHTSELQSLMRISYAVFCLKKQNIHIPPITQK